MEPVLTVPIKDQSMDTLLTKEWLVTNGLGGYASGTILGVNTRRHHGLFVPNLPAPRGRTLLLSIFEETVGVSDQHVSISGAEFADRHLTGQAQNFLKDFCLQGGMPVWTFDISGHILEKVIWMPYGQNTVCVTYRLLQGDLAQLKLRPFCTCRKHDGPLGYPEVWPFNVSSHENRLEIAAFEGAPVMRLTAQPFYSQFFAEQYVYNDVFYRLEHQRGLDCIENPFSPGYFNFDLRAGDELHFCVSSEEWDVVGQDLSALYHTELDRRQQLLVLCPQTSNDPFIAQLVLAADQFVVLPKTRTKNLKSEGLSNQARTVIAGYHWFTDWGRDTMISLEGLTLCTGRSQEARTILSTFAHYVDNGLLPNHFPEGQARAIYNTVDATFWYFHALDRYLQWTNDQALLQEIYPILVSIIDHHVRGTDFGIHVDPEDGLITAAAEGFQLTWMDAKVDEWVVTPRRGKPVEIQALWFNALKLMESWSAALGHPSHLYSQMSDKVFTSFNAKFWYVQGGYLYDVIDTAKGCDQSFRPNQVFSLSLRFPVLKQESWKSMIDVVQERLLTPYGLRSLERTDKEYHSRYEGSRWNRDAAYHQGLVWAWLIGPFLDAWMKVYNDGGKMGIFLDAFKGHLNEAGIGSISEIFDAEEPYYARGCIAQAWSVAEVLRTYQQLLKPQDKPIKED